MAVRATVRVLAIGCVWLFGVTTVTFAQQEEFKNLQYFPTDIARPALIQKMREFSFALGVRCEFCHVEGPDDTIFDSDEKLTKRRARYMLQMVDTINSTLVAGVPERSASGAKVECATCHRASAQPKLLGAVLTEVIAEAGPDAAIARYKELRQDMLLGKYNFGEWTINELARELRLAGDDNSAIAMLEMNAEYYPESNGIDMALASLYEQRDRDHAIALYRGVLARQPDNRGAREALARLEGAASSPR